MKSMTNDLVKNVRYGKILFHSFVCIFKCMSFKRFGNRKANIILKGLFAFTKSVNVKQLNRIYHR